MYDHFHATYKTPDGLVAEIEGGLSPKLDSEGWTKVKRMPEAVREAWMRMHAIDWGMPADAAIIGFRVAG